VSASAFAGFAGSFAGSFSALPVSSAGFAGFAGGLSCFAGSAALTSSDLLLSVFLPAWAFRPAVLPWPLPRFSHAPT
jgi:hypothetical protein